jgi:hypothetical protein
MSRLVRKALFAGFTAVAMAACGNDVTGTDPDAVAGEYLLISIDGQPLPVIVDQVGNDIAEVTQGSVSLEADGRFSDVTELRLTESGVTTTEVDATQGTWAVVGTTISFMPNDGSGNYTMTWDRQDRLTQLFQGFTLVYERETPLTAAR